MFLKAMKIPKGWPLADEEGGGDVAIKAEVMWRKSERYMKSG